jgi:hypothetical protein
MTMMKPKTVMNKWRKLCKKVKSDKTRRKAPGRKEAKNHAAMAGMKSMLEVEMAAEMDRLKMKWKYEPIKLEYHKCPNWCRECLVKTQHYEPDFVLENGTCIETKGKMTLDTRKKMVAVKACHPDVRIIMVFGYANNKLSARPNSTRYWQWCEAEGYEWTDKEIRKEWAE